MKRVLIVVDMQNDFIDGSVGTDMAVAIVPKVVEKIKEYKKEYDGVETNIFCTRDTHFKDYLNTLEGKSLPVEHCIKGTNGWEISNKIKSVLGGCEELIDKYTFGSTDLAEDLRSLYLKGLINSIELVGLCTDICVVSNALLIKATLPDIEIIVDAGCCAGVTPETHRAALQTMKMCQINVINEEGFEC